MFLLYKAANKATAIRPYEPENVKIKLYCQLYNFLLIFSDTYGLMGVSFVQPKYVAAIAFAIIKILSKDCFYIIINERVYQYM
jgi:hypothetical protein